ncbi:MAG: PorP/SprF family type IX secretion system membrane protein [Methylococcaceae bacterium]
MKNKKLTLLFFLFHLCVTGFAQDVLLQTQSTMKQEFINPAFSSLKSYTSINLMNRYQWLGQLSGAPVTYAAHVYIPMSETGLGVSFMAINQAVGLRKKTSFSGSFSHNLRINRANFLSLGYSVGLQNVSFDTKRLQAYPDINLDGINLSDLDVGVSIGMLFYDPTFFVGLSSNMLITKSMYSPGWMIQGFDLTAGYMYRISNSVFFRPDMVLKYYPAKQFLNEFGENSQSPAAPVLDLGVNFLVADRLWFGTSHCLGQAQTFSVDVIIKDAFKFGYIYEIGMGKGLNQFSSQGIRLVWSFISKSELKRFNRTERHNLSSKMCTYLYR